MANLSKFRNLDIAKLNPNTILTLKNIAATFALGIFIIASSSSVRAAGTSHKNAAPTDSVEAPVRKLVSERPRMSSTPVAPLAIAEENNKLVAKTSVSNALGEDIIQDALAYMGTRYRSGGMSPAGFDCSGFTSYVFKKNNVSLLRDSRSQYTQGTAIRDISDLRAGDLVFFGGRGARGISHVGIVMSVNPDGRSFKFVHSSSSQGVTVSNSNEAYYSRRYVGARRVLGD